MVSAIMQDPTAAGYVKTIAQLVDDMAALLAQSTLQLLGGACGSSAAAVRVLQVSRGALTNFLRPAPKAVHHGKLCRVGRHIQGC